MSLIQGAKAVAHNSLVRFGSFDLAFPSGVMFGKGMAIALEASDQFGGGVLLADQEDHAHKAAHGAATGRRVEHLVAAQVWRHGQGGQNCRFHWVLVEYLLPYLPLSSGMSMGSGSGAHFGGRPIVGRKISRMS